MYVLTGLFDEMTGRLPEGSFAHAVFGDSLRYFKGFAGSLDAKQALCEAGVVPGSRSGAIGEAWSGGGSMYPPERPAGARKVVAAPLRQGEGANRHFSRQHGRRDHNWQWDMLKSPWSLKLMEKGRLALDVSEEEANEFEEAGIIAFPGHVVKHKDSVKNGGYGKTIGTLVLRSPESAFVCVQVCVCTTGVDWRMRGGRDGRVCAILAAVLLVLVSFQDEKSNRVLSCRRSILFVGSSTQHDLRTVHGVGVFSFFSVASTGRRFAGEKGCSFACA